MKMGLREANQNFSRLMKAVKQGKEVLLTERGKPLAVIRPVDQSDNASAAVQRMESAGLLRAASKQQRLPRWTPRAMRGVSLSRTISADRDES